MFKISNLSIKKQLLFIGISIAFSIFLIALLSIILLYQAGARREYSNNINNLFFKEIELDKIKNSFFINDLRTSEFYKNKTSDNLENYKVKFQLLIDDLHSAKESKFATEFNISNSLHELEIMLNLSDTLFNVLVLQHATLGNESHGLKSEIINYEKNIQIQTQKDTIYKSLELENLFFQRKLLFVNTIQNYLDYIKTYDHTTNKLQELFNNKRITEEEFQNLQKLFTNYTMLITQIHDIYQKIFSNDSDSYLNNIARADAICEEQLSVIEANVANNVKKSIKIRYIGDLFIVLFFGTFLILFLKKVANNILLNLTSLQSFVTQLSKGAFPKPLKPNGNNEIVQLIRQLTELEKQLINTRDFAIEVGNGNFQSKITAFCHEEELGKALFEMRNKLLALDLERKNNEANIQIQSWITTGVANFGEILRNETGNFKKLSQNIINHLVEYLNINQGALFIINRNDSYDIYIEPIATIAYNRERKLQKRLELDEGLIGRVIEEKETIYLNDIPQNYIEITSGLGNHNPKFLLIVPLKIDNVIFGVIELASFFEIKKHEIEFVEKIAESIAVSISVSKNVENNKLLLIETKKQSQALRAKEDELRNNVVELQSIQEELARKEQKQKEEINRLLAENDKKIAEMQLFQSKIEDKEAELQGMMQAINASSMVTIFDLEGRIIDINDNAINYLNVSKEEIIGKRQKDFIEPELFDLNQYNNFWRDLNNGKLQKKIHKVTIKGADYWFSETYSTIYNKDGQPIKVMNVSENITQIKRQEFELQILLNEANKKEIELKSHEQKLKEALDESILKEEQQQVIIEEFTKKYDKQLEKLLLENEKLKKEIEKLKK